MLLADETLSKFGYKIEDLDINSYKPVFVQCDYCAKVVVKTLTNTRRNKMFVNKDTCGKGNCQVLKWNEVTTFKFGNKTPTQQEKINYYIGKTFGLLTVLNSTKDFNSNGKRLYDCKCVCGNYKKSVLSNLIGGLTTSCGCRRLRKVITSNPIQSIPKITPQPIITPTKNTGVKVVDLSEWISPKATKYIGERFGKLIIVGRTPYRIKTEVVYACKCTCGIYTYALRGKLKLGKIISCGCDTVKVKEPHIPLGFRAIRRSNRTTNNSKPKSSVGNTTSNNILECITPTVTPTKIKLLPWLSTKVKALVDKF